ncbi:divergent polysaccharide deacetylase family protein [Thalassotalea agarivorans]|uniref:Divergent polysaccharide deacetylase n=1 Tax=Thalassotalea agarivorans TaxID=349064 RepID=A0A1I0HQH9_THASX|nr:divergent polysaccharide deacetylase family protein [Thalassotalea agarivorans]SET86270.1 hypothetical protein SAMN05660429_02903 [Thalassotalea agarivorans]
MRIIFSCLLLISTSILADSHQVAIVIDDIGYRQSDVHAMDLPGKVTFAILPHTPLGKRLAQRAHAEHKDVILHIPMESALGKKLGPGALTSDMSEAEIHASLEHSFEEIPFAKGINNHMGSYLTTLHEPMMSTMKYLRERNAFFLDSVTTNESKALSAAKAHGVPTLSRHIFLDNNLTEEYIAGQFQLVIEAAQKRKHVIAIGHPHPKTVEVLTKLIPTLEQHDIHLVPLSKLLINEPVIASSPTPGVEETSGVSAPQ